MEYVSQQLFFLAFIRVLLESYIDFSIAVFINLQDKERSTFGDQISYIIALSILPIVSILTLGTKAFL